MRRSFSVDDGLRPAKRAGAAVAIVLVLIGVFAIICQTLTMLVAIQYQQALNHADQAQAQRLAEAGLLRASTALARDPQWSGETWKPALSSGRPAAVLVTVTKNTANIRVRAEATFTTSAGRIHKSNQTLDVPTASGKEVTQGSTP